MSLTGFAGFTKVCKIFELLIYSLAAWPVNGDKSKCKLNPWCEILATLESSKACKGPVLESFNVHHQVRENIITYNKMQNTGSAIDG